MPSQNALNLSGTPTKKSRTLLDVKIVGVDSQPFERFEYCTYGAQPRAELADRKLE